MARCACSIVAAMKSSALGSGVAARLDRARLRAIAQGMIRGLARHGHTQQRAEVGSAVQLVALGRERRGRHRDDLPDLHTARRFLLSPLALTTAGWPAALRASIAMRRNASRSPPRMTACSCASERAGG